nr:hypothetical protein Iba_scaffold27499CG0030 [Ipomoea batatas]
MRAGFVSKAQPRVNERKPASFPIILKLCILEIVETLTPADRNSQQPPSSPSSEHGSDDTDRSIRLPVFPSIAKQPANHHCSELDLRTRLHHSKNTDFSDHNICLVNCVLSVVRE